MNKERILDEIRRIAKSDGKPPGMRTFTRLSGIAKHEWYGRFWARWGDALKEAGFQANSLQGASDEEVLLRIYLELAEELQRIPTDGEIRLRSSNDKEFPSESTFRNRLGRKRQLLQKALSFAYDNNYSNTVIGWIEQALSKIQPILDLSVEEDTGVTQSSIGYVYLMRSGKHYKIGKTNSIDRRKYEVGLQLPERVEPVHSIETDDPSGIEAYWHNRFRDKRVNGEWFLLTASDVRVFRKRKFM